jgi:hypothetical protein
MSRQIRTTALNPILKSSHHGAVFSVPVFAREQACGLIGSPEIEPQMQGIHIYINITHQITTYHTRTTLPPSARHRFEEAGPNPSDHAHRTRAADKPHCERVGAAQHEGSSRPHSLPIISTTVSLLAACSASALVSRARRRLFQTLKLKIVTAPNLTQCPALHSPRVSLSLSAQTSY